MALALDANADEGMWLPSQLPGIAKNLKGAGFRGDPQDLADLTRAPLNAVVRIGGGTGSFVSDEGLVVNKLGDALASPSTEQRCRRNSRSEDCAQASAGARDNKSISFRCTAMQVGRVRFKLVVLALGYLKLGISAALEASIVE